MLLQAMAAHFMSSPQQLLGCQNCFLGLSANKQRAGAPKCAALSQDAVVERYGHRW
jgi:hypothetical protein